MQGKKHRNPGCIPSMFDAAVPRHCQKGRWFRFFKQALGRIAYNNRAAMYRDAANVNEARKPLLDKGFRASRVAKVASRLL